MENEDGTTLTADERAAIDTIGSTLNELKQAVEGMKNDKVDRATVEAIAAELIETQAAANPTLRRREAGIPDAGDDRIDVLGKQGAERLYAIQSRPAKTVARMIGRPEADVRAFQQAADNLVLLQAISDEQAKETGRKFEVQETSYYRDEYLPLAQAMDTATTAEGTEFLPRELSPNLIERVNLELRVAALFPSIPMPTNPYYVPGRPVSRQKLGLSAENTADTGQTGFHKLTPASRKVTLTAKKFAGEALVSKEAEEDLIIPMLPFMQEELVDYMAADIEDAITNGDTAGTMDTGWASDDPRKNFDGLRKNAQAAQKIDGAGATLSVALLRGNRKAMGKYGVSPDRLAHVLSINAFIEILSDTALLTLEKYGPQATVLTGELGKVDNIPVLVSEYVRVDLNASGVFDNVTKTKTEAITVYRNGWFQGERRGLTVQVLRELYAEYDQDAILVSLRRAFTPRFPVASEPIVALTYNLIS
jgi:HK97 family phage major capsid protein